MKMNGSHANWIEMRSDEIRRIFLFFEISCHRNEVRVDVKKLKKCYWHTLWPKSDIWYRLYHIFPQKIINSTSIFSAWYKSFTSELIVSHKSSLMIMPSLIVETCMKIYSNFAAAVDVVKKSFLSFRNVAHAVLLPAWINAKLIISFDFFLVH